MIVKTFRAPTVEEALAKVKATLGPSALIIETRRTAPRGFLGFLRKPVVEVVVGIEEAPGGRLPGPRAGAPAWATEVATLRGLQEEIGRIGDALRLVTEASSGGVPAPFHDLMLRLVEQGIEPPRAAGLVEECRAEPGREGQGAAPLEQLRAVLTRRFRTAGDLRPAEAEKPRVVALVGPTGAGKTTLLVKLASRMALARNETVALASMDFFRVGAVEQLKAYAEILSAPFHFIPGPGDVRKTLQAARAAAWLFVDTPGLACRDRERIAEVARWLDAFPRVQRHLVLSAATESRAAIDAIESYKPMRFDCLAFTKLDEARRHGVLLTAAEAAGVPVSHLGTGQDVARDLEVATPERLVELLLEPSLVKVAP